MPLIVWCALSATAQAQLVAPLDSFTQTCGPLVSPDPQRIRPMDYRTEHVRRPMVETYHFPPHVENLIRPIFTTFGSSISYTLHGYPNHVRALATMVRLGEREKTDKPAGADYTIDCYFQRALRFTPDDQVVRMLYVSYLGKRGRREDALRLVDSIDAEAGNDPMTRRNLGLVFLELKLPERALAQLDKADPTDPAMLLLRRTLHAGGHLARTTAAPAVSAASAP